MNRRTSWIIMPISFAWSFVLWNIGVRSTVVVVVSGVIVLTILSRAGYLDMRKPKDSDEAR